MENEIPGVCSQKLTDSFQEKGKLLSDKYENLRAELEGGI